MTILNFPSINTVEGRAKGLKKLNRINPSLNNPQD